MAWTDEMVEELKRLWAEGVTTGEIGRRLNISKNSIVGKVHRLGLSGRPSPIKKKSGRHFILHATRKFCIWDADGGCNTEDGGTRLCAAISV